MRAASMATHQPSSSRAITCQPSGVTLVRWCGMRSVGSTRTVSRQQTASQRSQRFLMEKARKMRRRHRTPAALAPYTLGVSGCEPYPGGSCIRHVRPRIGVDVDGTTADRFGCRSTDAALHSVLRLHAPHATRRPGPRRDPHRASKASCVHRLALRVRRCQAPRSSQSATRCVCAAHAKAVFTAIGDARP